MSTTTNVDGVITSTGNLQVITSSTQYGVHTFRLVEPISALDYSVVRIVTGFNNPPPGSHFIVTLNSDSFIGFDYMDNLGLPSAPAILRFYGKGIILQPDGNN